MKNDLYSLLHTLESKGVNITNFLGRLESNLQYEQSNESVLNITNYLMKYLDPTNIILEPQSWGGDIDIGILEQDKKIGIQVKTPYISQSEIYKGFSQRLKEFADKALSKPGFYYKVLFETPQNYSIITQRRVESDKASFIAVEIPYHVLIDHSVKKINNLIRKAYKQLRKADIDYSVVAIDLSKYSPIDPANIISYIQHVFLPKYSNLDSVLLAYYSYNTKKPKFKLVSINSKPRWNIGNPYAEGVINNQIESIRFYHSKIFNTKAGNNEILNLDIKKGVITCDGVVFGPL